MKDLVSGQWRHLGFTIIELLIVMSILGVATTLVSAAYLSFEKRERVKSAALDLKSNLRLAQNKALSGDKGISGSGEECLTTSTLVGWFVRLEANKNSYEIAGACQVSPGVEVEFATKTVNYPEGVSLYEIYYDGNGVIDFPLPDANNVLFRPIEREVYTFWGYGPNQTPPFYDGDGNLRPLFNGESDQNLLRLTLKGFDTTYEVNVFTSGEINEKKL